MAYTLKQAAEATGKSKPTILRAIQSHKISAARDPATQGWLIDPAELHRVYPPVTDEPLRNGKMKRDVIPSNMSALGREIEIRDERVAALQDERQRERQDAQNTIDDLRRRLDAEAEERRKLTALLTDQRPKPEEPVRRSWWRFGKRPE
jgi:excisionase family DNA binding protein